jgi:hypothetical protein
MQPGVGYRFSSSSSGITLDIGDPWPETTAATSPCPFTIVNASSGETYKFSAIPGMVNSVIPQIGITADATKRLDQLPVPTTTFNFDPTTGYSYIYLKVSADYSDSPTVFPVTTPTDILYPRITSNSVEQASTDDSAFFLLATAYQDPDTKAITIWQLTCGSQWCDRIKFGTQTARYYFARA